MLSTSGSPKTTLAATLFLLLFLCGCATQIGVERMEQREAYRALTANVITDGNLSSPTTQMLNRLGLAGMFKSNPAEVIATLHRGSGTEDRADRLFALAELSFLHASRNGGKPYFLAASIYAYAMLFAQETGYPVGEFDPRFRTAMDIYNLGLAGGFSSPDGAFVNLGTGIFPLPFGELELSTDSDYFFWGDYRLEQFVDASKLSVRGLRNDYRWPGVGAPLAASTSRVTASSDTFPTKVPSEFKVPVTAFVRFENLEEGLRNGRISGRLELYTPYRATSIDVAGRTVPVEFRPSAVLAYSAEGARIYSTARKGFLSGDYALFTDKARFRENIFFVSPYKPGKIPVVFIHGTASSAVSWMQMLNELQNDRRLWEHYQFWFFSYNTGNPVLYSGGLLTRGLKDIVQGLDPLGQDPALKNMVLIGHSQGGLLAKLAVIESGKAFRDGLNLPPIDELDISPESLEIIQRSLFYEPLPFVKRVIFISTPHRGSPVAGGWIGRMAGKLVSVPLRLIEAFAEIVSKSPQGFDEKSARYIPKSTDNMDLESPFLQIYDSLPISPGISAHSIISVMNMDKPKEKWSDGVVEYKSAHMEGVDSELVVDSWHSTHKTPQTIEEVRRILLLHLDN